MALDGRPIGINVSYYVHHSLLGESVGNWRIKTRIISAV